MKDGLYKAAFITKQDGRIKGSGTGVVVVSGGNFRGGDSTFAYRGTMTSEGAAARAELTAFRHSDGPPGVFGVDYVTASLSGPSTSEGARLSGTSPEAPGVDFAVTLSFLE